MHPIIINCVAASFKLIHMPTKMNLSFAGCGFLGIYHVGVAVCLKKYAPHLLLNKISGASAGAIAACCLLCDLPLEARSKTLGPFSPSFNVQNVLLEGLLKVIPDDAHERVSGKLHISLTRVYDGKNVIVSQFNSKEDLLQALLASSFIPFFSGLLPPRFHGVRYMDGGFSDNLPTLDENTITVSPFCGESDICPRDSSYQLLHALLSSSFIPIFSGWIPPRFHGVRYIDGCYSDNLPILDENTITVSPFCGESDICPRDDTYNVLQVNLANTSIELSRQNIYRFARILFPPNPEILSNMCKQGFDDALRFLHRNNLINCTRCLAVQSTFTVSEALDEGFDFDPNCHECKQQRQANKGLVNWVFKHRGMKLLSVLSLPCVLPADIVYATFTKFLSSAPHIGHNLKLLSQYLISNLATLVSTKYDLESVIDVPAPKHNQMNFNFTLNLEDEDLPTDQTSAIKFQNRMLGQASRRSSSYSLGRGGPVDADAFDQILQVTAHHDALMAFYYLDENNKVKVTEIFDVTDADTAALLSPDEREINTNLEFDEDWDQTLSHSDSWNKLSQNEDDACEDDRSSIAGSDSSMTRDSTNIFSDPESEWLPENSALMPPLQPERVHPDLRPESEQPDEIQYSLML
ncbi:hypothetical protein B566_EDAN001334 [Ephemera danica]|nr:hypothetical protein B566_EDAN001334 [Ephemera danica]